MSTKNSGKDGDDTKDEEKVEDQIKDGRDSDTQTEIPVEQEIWEERKDS